MFDTDLHAAAYKKIPHKFLLANMVALRVRQLENGADPLVEAEGLIRVDIALKEIVEGMIEPREPEVTTGEDLFA